MEQIVKARLNIEDTHLSMSNRLGTCHATILDLEAFVCKHSADGTSSISGGSTTAASPRAPGDRLATGSQHVCLHVHGQVEHACHALKDRHVRGQVRAGRAGVALQRNDLH